jgi:hypothetical protein
LSLTRPIGLVLAGLVFVTMSCQLLLRIDEPVGHDREPDSGTRDPCTHAGPPPPPDVDDDPSAPAQRDYWLAGARVIVPYHPDAGSRRGVDLDDSCTCQVDVWDGAAPCDTPGATGPLCDDENGIDDALGALGASYASLVPGLDLSEQVNRDILRGEHTILISLSGYNGLANDKDVSASMSYAGGLFTDEGCNGEHRDSGVVASDQSPSKPGIQRGPVFDGCDRWTPEPGTVTGRYPNRRATSAVAAYVNNFDLVIPIKEVTLSLFGGLVRATNAIAVAHLTREGTGFRADGFVAGRVPFAELVGAFARDSTPRGDSPDGSTQPICATKEWGLIAPIFCGARDTMLSPSGDHTGQVCDSISASIGFVARPAQIADGEYANPVVGQDCPNAAVECPAR